MSEQRWTSVRRIDSTDTSVSKFVFEREDAVAEAVLYRHPTYEQRTVVCCSTQSGCPMGCKFCGSGNRFVRSLTSDEIIEQVTSVFAQAGIDHTRVERMQLMFMSMGEPMLNMRSLGTAIRMLNSMYPNAELLVSTSAPRVDYRPFIALSAAIDKIGLQFSVHETTDEARNRLIPFKDKLTLAEIALTGDAWSIATGRSPFFNYCVHEGNASDDDADRLRAIFDPSIWEVTLSVICERDEGVSAASARQLPLLTSFRKMLGDRGYNVRIFDPAGQDDIGGGCGQLWYVQRWMKEHADRVKENT